MVVREDILALLSDHRGRRPTAQEECDLVGLFGLDGDDMWDFLEDYRARFAVNMDGYLWYFHQFDEPPVSRRVFAVAPDGCDLPMMPVSVDMLLRGAATGTWPVTYPEHRDVNRWWRTRWGWMLGIPVILIALGSLAAAVCPCR